MAEQHKQGLSAEVMAAIMLHAKNIVTVEQDKPYDVFSPEADEYLRNNPSATVIVAVEAKTRPDITSAKNMQERKEKEIEAGREDIRLLSETLELAKEEGEKIIFQPQYRNSSVKLTAPSEFVRSLAYRRDIMDIDILEKPPLPPKVPSIGM
jgi:hypothetical protein